MTPGLFSLIFLLALLSGTLLHLWLQQRQIRHVAACRSSVPVDFADSIPLESHQRSADYTVVKSRFKQIETLIEGATLLAFTLGGGIDWLNDVCRTLFTSPLTAGVALLASFTLLSSLINLPGSIYATFRIEARFGFNNMTPRLFFIDLAKSTFISALIGLPLITLILWLMNKMGTHWWLWVWIVWVAFSLFMMLAYPTFIAPLFNKFEPLADEALKQRIEALLLRCGFKSSGVFVMDGSKRSSHGNAYFTGLGQSKRIVFFDTLLKQLDPQETEAVLAHELGHFKCRHVLKRLAWMFSLALGLLWLLGQIMQQDWFYQGLGVSISGEAVALLLFFLVLPVFTFIFAPVTSWLSRRQEFEADAYAAQHASPSDLIQALVKLYRDNASTLTPDPLFSMFYYSHPPAAIRIATLRALG
ncbi:STE24 endopeptidase [Formivibrio citricus]|uniref:STE24 endopeptidase n=1 Tax=Formivibrio citricus TaxID=83765 RepID=A0A1I4X9U6_9NEIS|nr:M48 family metallopeptidase [Formivibrio citricus]SFN22721.1 STE24 endopeptidase [Formivibrio citricus]